MANKYFKNIAFIMANKKIWLNLPPNFKKLTYEKRKNSLGVHVESRIR